ncbi:type II and III secretion system protein family protein [Tepidamorphus sp. 3E244]|uniref:type II and III secretion system protein family protein n=1 Tax=Tepidamorphus sp. 3E244 TaxID=3385498 RepID=UPI0038FCF863
MNAPARCAAIARRMFAVAATVFVMALAQPATTLLAADQTLVLDDFAARSVQLGLNKSLVVDLPRDAADVLVSSPKVADAVMRSSRRAYLIGMEIGETNVFFFDDRGEQIAALEIVVSRDLRPLEHTISQLIPGSDVRAESMADNIVLSGMVRSPLDAQKAMDIAARFVGDKEKVLSMIGAEGSEQVTVKVRIVEVKRSTLKQLGIDFPNAVIAAGSFASSMSVAHAFGATNLSPPNSVTGTWTSGGNSVSATVRALEKQGLLRVLAEPNLSAISGESAKFLAGGEFPVPVGRDSDGNIIIEYKEFGVGLAIQPVVMSGERISLRVSSEVSELSDEDQISLGSISLPSITVRRAETTVEMPSGGSLVIAGLIRQDRNQVINGLPVVKDLPILGALFRSTDFVNNETEMVAIVTPHLVKPVAERELSMPSDNLHAPNDHEQYLLGRLNKIYGVSGAQPEGPYHGHIGFIVK